VQYLGSRQLASRSCAGVCSCRTYSECAATCSGLCIRSAEPAIYVTGILARFVLLTFVSLILERHSYGPHAGGEFRLWDDLLLQQPTLVSAGEKRELVSLSMQTESRVTLNVETGRLELIDLDDWRAVLESRDH
jgi:hypothetical protein